MSELKSKSPCAGMLPLAEGQTTLREIDLGVLTTVSPFAGQTAGLGKAMKEAHGLAWPAANICASKGDARLIWFGRDMALLAGPRPDARLSDHAAITDQSDAWASVELSGPDAEAVLARLVPLDLRVGGFGIGQTARSQLGHMQASITRSGPDGFVILVFRSMAHTLVHEIKEALEAVTQRD